MPMLTSDTPWKRTRAERFELEVLGKNGVKVNGTLHMPGGPHAPLPSPSLLQIGEVRGYEWYGADAWLGTLSCLGCLAGGMAGLEAAAGAWPEVVERRLPPQQHTLHPPHFFHSAPLSCMQDLSLYFLLPKHPQDVATAGRKRK